MGAMHCGYDNIWSAAPESSGWEWENYFHENYDIGLGYWCHFSLNLAIKFLNEKKKTINFANMLRYGICFQ